MSKVPQRENWQETLEGWRTELDRFYEGLNSFSVIDEPGEIMRKLSAMSARASEMRTQIVRLENKSLSGFRTREVDPFLTECDRQFKIWSRVLSVMQVEVDLTRGS